MSEQNQKHILIASVIKNKMNKSAVVKVSRSDKHPVYEKYIQKTTRFTIHDENNSCQVGDTVKVAACRPISKTKHWMLVEIVERAMDN